MRTRSQVYATNAFGQINSADVKDAPAAVRNKYGSLALKLPALIRTAGLAQALAFAEVRGGAGGQKLLDHIAATVLRDTADRRELLERARAAGLEEYMNLTRRTLDALEWYGRFARSILHIEPGAEEEGAR